MAIFQSDEKEAPDKRPRADAWVVYEHYDVGRSEGARCVYAPQTLYQGGKFFKNPPIEYAEGRQWYALSHKASSGGLFVDFAGLVDDKDLDVPPKSRDFDTDKNAQVALEWAREWGVLGLTRQDDGWYDTRGGKTDTVAAFAFQAWAANSVLRLYEEATVEGGVLDTGAVRDLLVSGGYSPRWAAFATRTREVAKDYALHACEEVTQARVRDYCFPALFRKPGQYNYTQGFGSANLLGAIWMGMFWILWDDQSWRCRNPECNRKIFYRPTPERHGVSRNDRKGGYATRSDKVYCSGTCEKRHFYLRHTKPARAAAKAKGSA